MALHIFTEGLVLNKINEIGGEAIPKRNLDKVSEIKRPMGDYSCQSLNKKTMTMLYKFLIPLIKAYSQIMPTSKALEMQTLFLIMNRIGTDKNLILMMVKNLIPKSFVNDFIIGEIIQNNTKETVKNILETIDLTEEFSAINKMRDSAHATNISQEKGHKYFDFEYVTNLIHRLIKIYEVFGRAASSLLNSDIEISFVNQDYIDVYDYFEKNLHQTKVIFSGKNLYHLPGNIIKLRNLNHLNLDDNVLQILPPSLGDLPKLQFLYLQNNKLSFLPESLGKVSDMLVLQCFNNPDLKISSYLIQKHRCCLVDENNKFIYI